MRSFRVPSVPVPEFRLRWLTMTDGKTSMRELPVSYGSLSPFLKLAAKFRSYNIIGEYWCLKYVLQRLYRMKIYSKECLDFAFSLMSYVEQLRLEFPLIIPLADKRSAAPFVLCEATRMFERADTFDRHARYSVSLVQLYMQASNLFTVLSMLCELDDIAIKIQKYCKWRAWYLFNCFKNGETPLPAPKSVMLHLDSFQSDEERLQCPWKHEEIIPLGVKIGLPIQFWNFFSECEEHCVFFDMLVERFGHFNVVYKLCKSAMHALENDNEEDVIDKLERALRLAILIKCGIKACCVVFFEYVIRFVVILFISIFLNFATDMNKVIRFIWEDRFMEDATVCFGSKDAVLSLSHSDLDEGSSESLYQCDEWTSKKGKREKKDKGYCYLHRLSSEEQLVHIRPKPKKTVFGKLKDKNKEKDKEKEKEQKSKSKSKQKCKNKAETVAPAAPARPVFAVPLARALCNNPSYDRVPVPAFVRRCIDYINENALDQEGLYRVSPSVEELRNAVDNGEEPSFGDAYQAACLLKLFIRELPESLFTEELLDKFEHAAQLKSIAECLGRLCELIERLPAPNKFFLAYFFLHLHEITQRQERNKMTIAKMCFILQPLFNVSQQLLNAFLQNPQILFPNVSLKKYISPLRPASGKSLPTDPKAILEELAKQEFLLSHLHDEINSGINDPQKEEQLWDVQRLVTQLKRELKSLKKKNIDAFNEVEQESGPCIEMFEEKQLLAVHMDLRNKIEIQRAQIEELMRQMDDIGGQHAVLSARSVARFSDAELSPEKKFDPKWPEQYSALEDRKRELIESIFAVDTLHCKQYTTYNYTECIYCHSHYYYYYGYITTTVAKIQASSCTILEHTILITLQFSFCNFD
ncbi:RalA-binding protein 1, partial [Trichinella sp. T9]